jgi:hypothetical protein
MRKSLAVIGWNAIALTSLIKKCPEHHITYVTDDQGKIV